MNASPRKIVAAVAVVAYLVGGTALTVAALDTPSGRKSALFLTLAMGLLFIASFTTPGYWAVSLPFVTFLPVAIWSHAVCEPGYLDLCDLAWLAAAVVAVVFGLPVALLGAWLESRFRDR